MPRPKVTVVSYSDSGGGAFRCAYRMHRALVESGVDSSMRVVLKLTDDPTVVAPASRLGRVVARSRNSLAYRVVRRFGPRDDVYRSLGIFPTGLHRELDRGGACLLHFHWVCGEMISIGEIGATRTPIVWTLHDEWAFRGAEHFPAFDGDVRYEHEYRPGSGRADRRGWDIDRWTWRRKRAAWRRPMTAVCPSQWLADRASRSPLLEKWRIETIPNAIDTSVWQPRCKVAARKRFDLPADTALVVFGAIGGTSDPRKGGDLLKAALQQLSSRLDRPWALAMFGQAAPVVPESWPAPIHYLGHLNGESDLIDAYSAADLVVLPSRLENLPNVAIEAQACAVPVVAFATGGVPECLAHGQTGFLAPAFDTGEMARGIAWVLEDGQRYRELAANARANVVNKFSNARIARRLEDLYDDLAAQGSSRSA